MSESSSQETLRQAEGGRAEARRNAFLMAARDVFLEHGYEAANMAEIVKRAGGSLSTLYAQFGDKRGLFLAVIDKRVAQLTEQMQVELAQHAPIREGLTRIGERVLAKMLEPSSMDMFRVMVGQAKTMPDIAADFFQQGPDRVRNALSAYLADRVAAGEIKLSDPDIAAGVFIDLVRSRLHFRALLDPTFQPDEKMQREAVERAVKVFLKGVEAV